MDDFDESKFISEIAKMVLGREKLLSRAPRRTLTVLIFNYPKTTVLALLLFWSAISPLGELVGPRLPAGWLIAWIAIMTLISSAISLALARGAADRNKVYEILPHHLVKAWRKALDAEGLNPTWRQQEAALLRTFPSWRDTRPIDLKTLEPALTALRGILAADKQ